ncbi:D-lactate dehydrogenase [cytochrome] 1, mitochondrial [Candida viswanathii]|uniref:D-lactate dehydrogenase (cytochrome) n=1 Tax=Candida viswanathii TaxID=5486 RepID=A0A367XVF2_9ASCO|nr:D-lactate dehydrogenase [cytochrome] 1, mitochondrial [Candida viswanathii]
MSWRNILKSTPARLSLGVGAIISTAFIGYKYGQTSVINNPPQNLFPHSSTTKLSSLSPPNYCPESEIPRVVSLIEQLGIKVVNNKPEIDHHTGNDFTTHKPLPHEIPQFIIYPESTEQVSQTLKILNEHKVPVVPFSGGTSLEGHFHSTRRGVVVDTSKMNKVLQINDNDLDVVVQAGVNWQALNEVLKPYGLMFGTDCAPNGLISGMIGTNASGINASRYGAMSANVISITAVLADGTIVKTKKRPRKSSAGYNLTNLFIGSEGTLGIVTEATCKVHPIPKVSTVVVVQFPLILDATNSVAQVFRSGLQPTAIELLDKDMMECLNYSGYTDGLDESPTLFINIGAVNRTVVDENVKILKSIVQTNKASSFVFAKNDQEAEELFSARKNAFYAMINWGKNELDPDIMIHVTDIAVPISKLTQTIDSINTIVQDSPFRSIVLSHAGDGNLHYDIFFKPGEVENVKKIVEEMVDVGLNNDGTCTGEHGVGNAKRRFLTMELGDDTIDLMRKIKLAIDPNRILNPDKIFKIDPEDTSDM